MVSINRILVPTDFSDCSLHALDYALDLARKFKASLHLLHVVPGEDLFGVYGLPAPKLFPDLHEKARARLNELVGPEAAQSVAMETAVATGSPFLEIVSYANANRIDLIVMGTHGRGVIGHAVLGSVAEKVVRKASCAVLTIRPADAASQAA